MEEMLEQKEFSSEDRLLQNLGEDGLKLKELNNDIRYRKIVFQGTCGAIGLFIVLFLVYFITYFFCPSYCQSESISQRVLPLGALVALPIILLLALNRIFGAKGASHLQKENPSAAFSCSMGYSLLKELIETFRRKP